MLSQIAKQDVKIVVLAVDKEGRRVDDTPQNYGMVFGAAIAELLSEYPALSLTVDSRRNNLIQLADFVAGAMNAKYNNKDAHYTDIFKNKILKEKKIKWTELKKRIVNP